MNRLPVSKLTLSIIVALLAVVLIDVFCFCQLSVTDDSLKPQLQIGDRILVNKMAYIERHDIVAFQHPFNHSAISVSLGKVRSLPGDTLWIQIKDKKGRNCQWRPFIIPAKGKPVDVKPWNVKLLSNALHAFEDAKITIKNDTTLELNGKEQQSITFQNDYIWIMNNEDSIAADSKAFGILPISLVQGVASYITYSLQNGNLITDRCLKSITK